MAYKVSRLSVLINGFYLCQGKRERLTVGHISFTLLLEEFPSALKLELMSVSESPRSALLAPMGSRLVSFVSMMLVNWHMMPILIW